MSGWSAEVLAKFAPGANASWQCTHCLVYNPMNKMQCISCESPKAGGEEALSRCDNMENVPTNKRKELIDAQAASTKKAKTQFTFGVDSTSVGESSTIQNTTPSMDSNFFKPVGGFTFGVTTKVLEELDSKKQWSKLTDRTGTVYSVGLGDCGALGLGEEELQLAEYTSVTLLEKHQVAQVACGGMHSLALLSDQESIFSWGCNDDEALGREGDEMLPILLTKFTKDKIAAIEGGDCHSVALTKTGQVFTWGTYRDDNGYLGYTPSVLKQKIPCLVNFPKKLPITSIACGDNHTIAVTSDGLIYSWGNGLQGQLGRRVNPRRKKAALIPAPVSLGRSNRKKILAKAVYCGSHHSFAITACGAVFSWGLGNFGQLGHGSRMDCITPERIPFFDDKKMIKMSGGVHHSAGISEDGKLYAFGRCDSGQLGLGEMPKHTAFLLEPTLVASLPHIVDVSCGGNHTLALSEKCSLFVFGYGEMGQLGTGDEENEFTPATVKAKALENRTIVQARAGGQFSVIIAK